MSLKPTNNPLPGNGLLGRLNSPLAQISMGLLSAGAQGRGVGHGLLTGLQGYQQMQANNMRQQMLAAQLEDIKERRKEREEKRSRREKLSEIIGSPATQTPHEFDGFEGEKIPGLVDVQGGSGILADGSVDQSERAILGAHLMQSNPSAAASLLKQPSVGELEKIVGPDGNPVLVPRDQAVNQTPYIKPNKPSQPTLNQRSRNIGNGMVIDEQSTDRGRTWTAVSAPYERHKAPDKNSSLRADYNAQFKVGLLGKHEPHVPPLPEYRRLREEGKEFGREVTIQVDGKNKKAYEIISPDGTIEYYY